MVRGGVVGVLRLLRSTRVIATPRRNVSSSSSVGFSGAGFMGCYHIGVASCFQDHGVFCDPEMIVSGVSAGGLVAAGVVFRVEAEDAMEVTLEMARRTRNTFGGPVMTALKPGGSLVDLVHELSGARLRKVMLGRSEDLSNETLNLRIGVTEHDRKTMTFRYCYADQFRDIDDVIAVAVLSSYIPGITGPLVASSSSKLGRAMAKVREMQALGYLKGQGQDKERKNFDSVYYFDGGLLNMFPSVDERTIVVTPLCGDFSPNPFICPESKRKTKYSETENGSPAEMKLARKVVQERLRNFFLSKRAAISMESSNVDTLIRMVVASSSERVLEAKFQQGYNDARKFLDQRSLLRVHTTSG